MVTFNLMMKPDPIDPLLGAIARQPLPSPSDRLTANVWCEIERRRTQSIWTRMASVLEWRELIVEPRVAALGLVLAVVIGALPAGLAARAENRSRMVRQSIHFDVFAIHSNGSLGSVLNRQGTSNPTLRR